jgi:O-acetyl-ADP-ribose deacetylase (regulator of RNase III)
MKIEVVVGNIVMQPDVDALVNSANANLRLGSGVAGAIHTAAGPELEKFCQPFAPLELGAALITPGFNLANPWVIHVRSAHYILNTEPERYMAFAMFSMLNTARDNGIKSLAIPAIGTGVFKFPPMLAARITAKALHEFEKRTDAIDLIRICVVNEDLKKLYQSAIALEVKGC